MKHKHRWKVYSTALVPPTILVSCKCGSDGWVRDFTPEEWGEAFYAPSNPYVWSDNERVKVK